jgi:hypothetical protein
MVGNEELTDVSWSSLDSTAVVGMKEENPDVKRRQRSEVNTRKKRKVDFFSFIFDLHHEAIKYKYIIW